MLSETVFTSEVMGAAGSASVAAVLFHLLPLFVARTMVEMSRPTEIRPRPPMSIFSVDDESLPLLVEALMMDGNYLDGKFSSKVGFGRPGIMR